MNNDYIEEYKEIIRKKKKAVRISLIFLGIYAICVVSFFINIKKYDENLHVLILLASMIFIPLIISISFYFHALIINKCPKCKKFMGKFIYNFCPVCGEKLRNK